MGKSRKRICVDCGMMFILQSDEPRRKNRCRECWLKNNVKSWQEEMWEMGCNVDDPNKMGDVPFIRPIKTNECKKVEVDGEKHRDITTLLFYDTKYKKTYPTMEELKQIELANERKRKYVMRKERKKVGKPSSRYISMEERASTVEKLINEGENGENIIKITGLSRYYYTLAVDYLKEHGRYNQTSYVRYTEEQDEEIIKLYKQGLTQREIGDIMDKTRDEIKGRIKLYREQGRI